MKATGRPRVIWFDRLGRVRPALMPNLANDDPAAIALCCAFFGTGAIAIALRTQCLSMALRNISRRRSKFSRFRSEADIQRVALTEPDL